MKILTCVHLSLFPWYKNLRSSIIGQSMNIKLFDMYCQITLLNSWANLLLIRVYADMMWAVVMLSDIKFVLKMSVMMSAPA